MQETVTEPGLRMCPECGHGFEPRSFNQVFCCIPCKSKWRYYHGNEGFPRPARCEQCGKEFEQKGDHHRFCSERCKDQAKHQRDMLVPERVQKNRNRWYQANKSRHQAKVLAYRLAHRQVAKSKTVTSVAADPWLAPAPRLDMIPGAFMPIFFDAYGRRFEHWQISALHGMLTRITGPHQPNNPVFSLLPWPSGCGWALYLRDCEMAARLGARAHVVEFDGTTTELMLGVARRIKAPAVTAGAWKMRVTALTPVHCRSDHGRVQYTAPTSNNIRGTLDSFTARRLGIKTQKGDVQVRMLDAKQAFPDAVRLAGNGQKLGEMSGWSGSVDVEVNALGRLLLECAGLGIGLGGKTAFGFGRVRVERI